MVDWEKRFMDAAFFFARWSKDKTQVGAVIVGDRRRIVSSGYNGLPRGVAESAERSAKPEKYLWHEHAERNAIYNAAEPLIGMALYTTHYPCAACARAIIQTGIVHVVWREALTSGFAADEAAVLDMFAEAGVNFYRSEP